MLLAHKIRLDPTNTPRTFFAQCVGTARFAYNWALEEWKQQYQAGEKPHEVALRQLLNGLKDDTFPWMVEVPKSVAQQAIKNLGDAFHRFFRGQTDYPKYNKKYHHDSARLDNGPPQEGSRCYASERQKDSYSQAGLGADDRTCALHRPD